MPGVGSWASPELLEALNKTVEYLEYLHEKRDFSEVIESAINQAHRAIDKAEGTAASKVS